MVDIKDKEWWAERLAEFLKTPGVKRYVIYQKDNHIIVTELKDEPRLRQCLGEKLDNYERREVDEPTKDRFQGSSKIWRVTEYLWPPLEVFPNNMEKE